VIQKSYCHPFTLILIVEWFMFYFSNEGTQLKISSWEILWMPHWDVRNVNIYLPPLFLHTFSGFSGVNQCCFWIILAIYSDESKTILQKQGVQCKFFAMIQFPVIQKFSCQLLTLILNVGCLYIFNKGTRLKISIVRNFVNTTLRCTECYYLSPSAVFVHILWFQRC